MGSKDEQEFSEETLVILNFPKKEEDKTCLPLYDWFTSLALRFDKSFLFIIIIENINFGLWVLISLCTQDLFKAYMKQDPGDMAVFSSIMTLPWSLKIIYGLISDNVPICGLKRRPYLIFFGYLQFITMYTIYSLDYDNTPALTVALLIMAASLGQAFSNVVVDAVLIVQSRKDPEVGSQDLISLAWLTQGIAGVVGCLLAAIFMEKYHPKYAYLGYAFYGLFLGTSCIFLSLKSEREYLPGNEPVHSEWSSQLEENQTPSEAQIKREQFEKNRPAVGKEGFWFNFKKNMRAIGGALRRPEIYCIVIYFVLDGLTSPSFNDFTYFFLMNVVGVSKFMFAMISLLGQVVAVIGVLIFNAFLKMVETRTLLFWNVTINIVAATLSYLFALRLTKEWGINDYAYLITTTIIFGSFGMALQTLPLLSLFAKITPHRIEGTMYAFFTGTMNLDQSLIQPLLGSWINNTFVGVNKDDQSRYPTLMLIALIFSPVGYALLFLIPTKPEIEKARIERETEENQEIEARKERRQQRKIKRESNKALRDGQQEGGQQDDEIQPILKSLL